MEKYVWPKSGRDDIPGSVSIEGEEFLYFEDDGKNKFSKQFDNLTKNATPRNSKHGSMGEEGCKILLPDGRLFHAISYNGDLEGWRKDIEISTKAHNIELATI